MKASGLITILTDFGLSDPYVGIMKGVILSINQNATVVDISHLIKPGSIMHAASLLMETYRFFPKGTVHLVVVDPGVGSERRPILVKTEDYIFVGPDNGVLWPVITSNEHPGVIHITERRYFLKNVSHTFHGRDIFAPVSAHLSYGADPLDIGIEIDDAVKFCLPSPVETKSRYSKGKMLSGQIMRVDHFGNLISNIHEEDLQKFLRESKPVIRIGDIVIEGLSGTYSDAKTGDMLAIIGSSGFLEIAVNSGRASDKLAMEQKEIIGYEISLYCL
ncbi:MAG TPA: SAM-dependent chlorinase/fluorinase [Desulfobacteraceae bacterium]|nr:SAM-dependent chlorinase/fluorinase [Desulfobacteraceae bacterium]HPJ68750.1 SAM-dependent chlorinase/fluorinase [Desulfobacteraceae bacterium]